MSKIWFSSKIGGQTPLLTWSFRCTILISFADGGLNVSFRSFCGHKNGILSYGFSFVAVMGGHNADSLQKLVVNIGCWLVALSGYSCCPCKWRAQRVVHHLMWPHKCYSKLRILICRRRVIPKFWLASKLSGQTLGISATLLADVHFAGSGCLELIAQCLSRPGILPLSSKDFSNVYPAS